MATRLFGVETEYALAAFDAAGARLDPDLAVMTLMRRAQRRLPWLPDGSTHGMFLANGARFYVDCGAHPELTTPECATPSDVVRYVRAGEAILSALAAERDDGPVARLRLFRGNVDYSGSGATWGCHASYMHRAERAVLPAQLVPHLASRIVYTGAGGFANDSDGLVFTLSPRVTHIRREVSGESTSNRGIFHDKREDLCSGGWRRMHEICGESVGSALALWLRVGCTALVLALCESGVRPGDAVALEDAVGAMRVFAADPTCTATVLTQHGARVRAIDIQRHYLACVEAHADAPSMPPWTAEVCRRWRDVLDVLECGWEHAATTLEWPTKLGLYRERARRRGVAWESLPAWTAVAKRLAKAWSRTVPHLAFTAAHALAPGSPIAATVRRQSAFLSRSGLDWTGFEPFLALRDELFEIDTRFGELGPDGLCTCLHDAGLVSDAGIDVGDVRHATEHPPDGSRARVRGELVRRLASDRDRFSCNWYGVWDHAHDIWVDLGDPFATTTTWTPRAAPPAPPMPSPAPPRIRSTFMLTAWRRRRGAHPVEPAPEIGADVHTRSAVAREYRRRGAVGESERLLVECLEREEPSGTPPSSARAHRHNDLALVVMRTGRLLEASAINAVAWSLNRGRHDVTSARILFTRVAIRLLLDDHDVAVPLGQVKLLVESRPLPCPPDVDRRWNVPDVVLMLNEQLVAADAALLVMLARALEDPRHVAELAAHPRWAGATPRPLDEPWPHRATLAYEPRSLGRRSGVVR